MVDLTLQKGKSVAIFINTSAMNKSVIFYKQRSAETSVFSLADTAKSSTNMIYVNYNSLLSPSSDDTEVNTHINIGSALTDTETSASKTTNTFANGSDRTKMKDCSLIISQTFTIDDTDKVKTDVDIDDLSISVNSKYVSTSSKFIANLIKVTFGTNIGIMFAQLAQ